MTSSSLFIIQSNKIRLLLSPSLLYVLASRSVGTLALGLSKPSPVIQNCPSLSGYSTKEKLRTRLFSTSMKRSENERAMTKDALSIVDQAIQAVDPYTAIKRHISMDESGRTILVKGSTPKEYDLSSFDGITLVAFGKASSAMAAAVLQQFESIPANGLTDIRIQGVVIVKGGHCTQDERKSLESHSIQLLEAGHPVPDCGSAAAAQKVMELVAATANPRTLVICCISGGGSALFCLPQDPLSMDDLKKTNQVLLGSGMSIQDMNVIRKRLESGKGGRLAAAAYPSTVISLILSDVLGDPLDLIASGPTVPDTSTFGDAYQLVQKNNLEYKLPAKVVQLLKDGMAGSVPDAPSKDHPIFSEGKSETVIVGNNELAVQAAAQAAHVRGYSTRVIGCRVDGEAKEVANMYAAMAQHLALQRNQSNRNTIDDPYALAKLPLALIAGGETTVSIPAGSKGKGGRNQELALAAALKFQQLGLRDVVLASVGTDGTDGPTDAAGGIVDGGTIARLENDAEEALKLHDSYNYLKQKDQDGHSPLVKTGATGTNVADICVLLLK